MVDINSINEEHKENKLAALWESQILEAQLRKANEAQNQNTTTDASGNDLSTAQSKDLKATQVVNNAPSASYVVSKHEQDKSLLQMAKLEQSLQKSASHIKTEQAAIAAAEAEARSARRAQAYLQAHPELQANEGIDTPFSTLDVLKDKPKNIVMGNDAKHEMRSSNARMNAHMHQQIQDELEEQAQQSNEQQNLRAKRDEQRQEQVSVTPHVMSNASFTQHNNAQNSVDNNQSFLSQNNTSHSSDTSGNNNNSGGGNNPQGQERGQHNADASALNAQDVNAANTQENIKTQDTVNDERFAFVNKDEDYEVEVSNEGEILSIIDPNQNNDEQDSLAPINGNDDISAYVKEEAIASYNEVQHASHLSEEFNPHAFLTKNDEAFLNQIADRTLRGSLSKVIADARYAGTLNGPLRAESLFTSPGILSANSAWLTHMAAGESENGKPFDGGILMLKAPIKTASELRDNLISLGTNMVNSLAAISKMPIDLEEENAMRVREQINKMSGQNNEPAVVTNEPRTISAQSYQQERFSDMAREEIKAKSQPTAESLGIFEHNRAMQCMHTWVDNTYHQMASDPKMQDKIASGGQEVRDFMEMLNISQRMSNVG